MGGTYSTRGAGGAQAEHKRPPFRRIVHLLGGTVPDVSKLCECRVGGDPEKHAKALNAEVVRALAEAVESARRNQASYLAGAGGGRAGGGRPAGRRGRHPAQWTKHWQSRSSRCSSAQARARLAASRC